MGALETTTITTHIETSSFRQHPKNVEASLLRWIPGKKFHPEYVTQAATPMWPIFDLRRFDTSAAADAASHAAAPPPLCDGGGGGGLFKARGAENDEEY